MKTTKYPIRLQRSFLFIILYMKSVTGQYGSFPIHWNAYLMKSQRRQLDKFGRENKMKS